jgi:hypothetical protein
MKSKETETIEVNRGVASRINKRVIALERENIKTNAKARSKVVEEIMAIFLEELKISEDEIK